MANLLPPASLKSLRRAQFARLLFAAGCVGSAVAIVALVSLIPSYLAIELGPHAPPQSAATAASSTSSQVIETQNLMAIAQPFSTTTATSINAIQAALALKPANIHIDHIDYSSSESGTIVLGGVAVSADALNAYRAALANEGLFKQVTVPVSALAGITNGRFAITLSGNF